MNADLLPCPFCGGANVAQISASAVACDDCCGEAPIHAWNTRAAAPEIARLRTLAGKNHDLANQYFNGFVDAEREVQEMKPKFAALEMVAMQQSQDIAKLQAEKAEREWRLMVGPHSMDEAFLPPMGMPVWLYLPDIQQPIIGLREEYEGGWIWAVSYSRPYWDKDERKWCDNDSEADDIAPSHWMPLPQPPYSPSTGRRGNDL